MNQHWEYQPCLSPTARTHLPIQSSFTLILPYFAMSAQIAALNLRILFWEHAPVFRTKSVVKIDVKLISSNIHIIPPVNRTSQLFVNDTRSPNSPDASTMAALGWLPTTFCFLTFPIQPAMTSPLPVAGRQPAGQGKQTSPPSCRRFVMRRRLSAAPQGLFLLWLSESVRSVLARPRCCCCWLGEGWLASSPRLWGCSKMTLRRGLVFAVLLCTSFFIFASPSTDQEPSSDLESYWCSYCSSVAPNGCIFSSFL